MPTLAQQALMQRLNLSAHGVAITVTVPNGTPVATSGIWHQPQPDTQPGAPDVHKLESRQVLEIPRDGTVADLPRGTVIAAQATASGGILQWRVVGFERRLVDRWYVIVTPEPNT